MSADKETRVKCARALAYTFDTTYERERGTAASSRDATTLAWLAVADRVIQEAAPMPADPTPAPEWAVKMGRSLERSLSNIPYATHEARGDVIARLLASVRDAALWEAADAVVDNVARWLDAERAILALIGTPPKESADAR